MENQENRTIETLRERLKELIAMIEDGAAPEAVLSAQRSFSNAVEDAKKRLDEGKIEVQVKGLPADMHLFATRDLPKIIDDEGQCMAAACIHRSDEHAVAEDDRCRRARPGHGSHPDDIAPVAPTCGQLGVADARVEPRHELAGRCAPAHRQQRNCKTRRCSHARNPFG